MILIKSSGGDRGQADEVRRPTRDRITGHVVADLKAYMKSEVKPKPRYLCELLNLVSVLRLHGAESADQWTELVESLRKVRDFLPTNRHFRDVKKIYNKTCTPLNINAITAADKKVQATSSSNDGPVEKTKSKEPRQQQNGGDDVIDDVKNENGKKKKKKSKSREGQQKRKEQKMNDYQGQLEDKEIPSFAGLLLNDNLNFAPVDDEAETKPESPSLKKTKKKRKISASESVADSTGGDTEKPAKKKSKKKKVAAAEDS